MGGTARTDLCTPAWFPGTGSHLVWVMGDDVEVGHRQSGGGVLYDAAPEAVLGISGEVAVGEGAVVELGLVVINIGHHDCHQSAGLGHPAMDVQVLLTCLGRSRVRVR